MAGTVEILNYPLDLPDAQDIADEVEHNAKESGKYISVNRREYNGRIVISVTYDVGEDRGGA